MSRLRQKYKKLKEKYELLANLPVDVKYILQSNTKRPVTLCVSQAIEGDIEPSDYAVEYLDFSAANEIAIKLVEEGCIRKNVTQNGDLTVIKYSVDVIPPFN